MPVPPLPEQKAIAEVLSSLDDKIDLLHRQNKTPEQMAETLFRQWFVEEAKQEWEEGVLGDLSENVRVNVKPTEMNASLKYIGLEHIDRRSITLNKCSNTEKVQSNKSQFRQQLRKLINKKPCFTVLFCKTLLLHSAFMLSKLNYVQFSYLPPFCSIKILPRMFMSGDSLR